jgi:mono/diheme cytochrome c family protein
MRAKNVIVAAALLCCALHGAAQAPAGARTSRDGAANGREVYLRLGCQACHGTVGHGGAGARLAPNTLPLEGFRTWVRNGTPGWTVARGMPAFPPSVLTDAEIESVRTFLASLPAPPAPNDIPLLNP